MDVESRSNRPDRKTRGRDQSKILKLKKYFDKNKTTPKTSSETQDDTIKDPSGDKTLDPKDLSTETTEDKTPEEAPKSRPASPEPNCAICLEPLTNKSFTDSCFHTFCFTCLVEWSRVKPECPLCKQRFKSIVHNVQGDYSYEEYHITTTRSPNLWTFLSESPRFRYPTTMTPLNILRRNLETLQEQLRPESFYNQRLTSQIESHRRRYAPHSVNVFSDPATSRPSYNYSFRNRVYSHDLWVMPAVGDRVRTVSPDFYRRNPACTHRLLPWLQRELAALMQNQESQITFIMELIMALIVRYEITSQEFFIHIEPYLVDKTRHFIHELYNFAISPHNMEAYDRLSNYSGPTHNQNQDDDDITIEHETNPTSESPLRRLVIKKKSDNQWETVPVPGRSSSSAGTSAPSTSNPGPSTSGLIFSGNPAVATSDNEDECQIVTVLKPRRERTPEIVDLSSDDEVPKDQVVVEVLSDDSTDSDFSIFGSDSEMSINLTQVSPLPLESTTIGNMFSSILSRSPTSQYSTKYPPSSDSDIECLEVWSGPAINIPIPPSRPILPAAAAVVDTTRTVENSEQTVPERATVVVEPTVSKIEDTKREPEKKPKLLSAIVRPWEVRPGCSTDFKGQRRHSADSKGQRRHSADSKDRSGRSADQQRRSADADDRRKRSKTKKRLLETPPFSSSSNDSDELSDKEPVKKLKLKSVVAHFTFDSSGQKCDSKNRHMYKKRKHHKDRKDKKRRSSKDKKHSHRHKHRIYSDSDSS